VTIIQVVFSLLQKVVVKEISFDIRKRCKT